MSRAPVSGPPWLGGQVAVVTGGARGIGRVCALALADAGARVVAMDVLDCGETVAAVRAAGGDATGVDVDVTRRPAVAEAIREAGRDRLDILVTAAGIYGSSTLMEDLDETEVDAVLGVNVKGTIWCLQAAFPLLAAHGGKVVCIGSVAGRVGGVRAGPHYVASKGAIHALVKWAAKAGAEHGVYCNGVAPGVVDTPMIAGKGYTPDVSPLGRLGQPEDIAQAVLYLASPASNYVTGTVLDVNGGAFMGA
jgi:3-oxoacyl-[acyl-carrier protein] reductase